MLRSILAVTFGVLLGVAFIIYLSFIVSQMIDTGDGAAPVENMKSLPFANQIGVVGVWFAGTLLGAGASSFLSRRWAPAAWVVAATMALFAVTNFSSVPSPLWMSVLSLGAIAAAGYLAVKGTRATYDRSQHPSATGPDL